MRSHLFALSLVLSLAACGKAAPASSPTPTPPATTSPAPTTPTATPSAAPTSTMPPGVDQLVRMSYRNGRVSGPRGRVRVHKGDVLRIVVTSDRADEVHLHGYDELVEVGAGGSAEITVKATITGIFELELEHRKVVLARFQVQ